MTDLINLAELENGIQTRKLVLIEALAQPYYERGHPSGRAPAAAGRAGEERRRESRMDRSRSLAGGGVMASIEGIGTPTRDERLASGSAMRVVRALVRTDRDFAPAVLRIGLGLVMFPHGAQKALGWFGGAGIHGTLSLFHRLE